MTLEGGYDICPRCGGLGFVPRLYNSTDAPPFPCVHCSGEGAMSHADVDRFWQEHKAA